MTDTTTNGAGDGTVTPLTDLTDEAVTDEMNAIAQALEPEPYVYRPQASTDKVHETIRSTLARVASEAITQASNFVYLADYGDRDKPLKLRYDHLVDAAECLELAMVHLGRLQDAVFHRLQIEEPDSVNGLDGC